MIRQALFLVVPIGVASAQGRVPNVTPSDSVRCPSCRGWNESRPAERIFANVYYVGTRGLSSILLTGPEGHILLDGGLPESAPRVAANIEALGFKLSDVKLIVNSHAHFDHAGGIAALQGASGARVVARAEAAPVLAAGKARPSDPQFGLGIDYPPVAVADTVGDAQTLSIGPIRITSHATGGHMPGGTSWTWRSCVGSDCLDFVYGDSQTAVSNDEFLFSRNTTYPNVLADFDRSFAFFETAPCDVLLTPHPSASSLFERLARGRDGIIDREACRQYAARSRRALADRLLREKGR